MSWLSTKFSLLQVAVVAFGGAFAGVLIGFLYFFPGAVHNSIREFQTLIVGGVAFVLGIWGFIETRRRDDWLHKKERRALMAAYAAELLATLKGMELTYWQLKEIVREGDIDDESLRKLLNRPDTLKTIEATAGQIGILGPDMAGNVVSCASAISSVYSSMQSLQLNNGLLSTLEAAGGMTLAIAHKLVLMSGDTQMSVPEKFPRAPSFEAFFEALGKEQPDESHPA